jgi:Mn2+/Fe2+ NRAMP family transporter
LSLFAGIDYILLLPAVGFLVWLVIWRLPFAWMERIFGLMGIALVVFAVTVWKIGPDWHDMFKAATDVGVPENETPYSYAYYAIALFGAAMTPYEVFFFSSGAVEEGWTKRDLAVNRANVFIGFPLGGLLSLSIMACSYLLFSPNDISVDNLSQVALPASVELGKIGLAVALLGIFAATFGAALETALSGGYAISQYLGWQWGKYVKPKHASRFHVMVLLTIAAAVLFGLSGVDPIKVTEYSIVLSAAALPLTYLPILIIANDTTYMGDKVNGRVINALGSVFLVILTVVSIATIPLMIITRGGA